MYERVEAVPVKPSVAPIATGTAEVNGATWSWSTLPAGPRQTLLLQAGAPPEGRGVRESDDFVQVKARGNAAACGSARGLPRAPRSLGC